MSFEDELKTLKQEVEGLKKLPDEIKEVKENVKTISDSLVAMSKAECEAKGGKWDDEKKTCKLPEKKESFSVDAFQWLTEDVKENLPFVHEVEENLKGLTNLGEVLETLQEMKAYKEVLAQYVPPAYGTPPAPPRYPAGLYPLPKFLTLMGKLCKSDENVGACIKRLKGEKEAEAPKTKEACEKAGGKWNEETKTCKLPEKKGGGESLQALGILPKSGGGPNDDKAKAKAFTEKVIGKKKEGD